MTAALPRLLQIAHGHTAFHPGGTEMVALALHRYWRQRGEDCWYLGAAEPADHAGHPGTNMIAMTDDQREAVLHTDSFIRFRLQQPDYFGCLREFANYLDTVRPDIVHFHHVLNLGLEAIHVARAVLPKAKIVLTLHDYYLICANNGQLYKYHAHERCMGPSLKACMTCIPRVAAEDFRMRELDIRRTLDVVDTIVSPSRFLAGMIEASIENCPAIELVENTYVGPEGPAAKRTAGGALCFAYFGNLSLVKGAGDLFAAATILRQRGFDHFSLQINGSQLFADNAMDEKIAKAKSELGEQLVFAGRYDETSLAERMAQADCVVFPSLWWENSPLVVYEALYHERMVVSYPHGGAAEILKRYDAGVLAEQSRPEALADAMQLVLEGKVQASAAARSKLRSLAAFAADYAKVYAG